MRMPLVPLNPMIARINVTPIIDVALVLVIILLITAPIMAVADLDIELPEARTRGAEDENRLMITLGKHGEIALEDEMVPPGELVPRLSRRLEKANADKVLIVVRADASVPHAWVRDLLKDLRSAGAKRLAIATTQVGKGDS